MIHHVTQRCAFIRMCREVERCYSYGQERCSEVLLPRPGFVLVIYVCMHSRPLKPVDCKLRLPRVLEACAWSAVHAHINDRYW